MGKWKVNDVENRRKEKRSANVEIRVEGLEMGVHDRRHLRRRVSAERREERRGVGGGGWSSELELTEVALREEGATRKKTKKNIEL